MTITYEIANNNLNLLGQLLEEGNTTGALFQAGAIYGMAQSIPSPQQGQVISELFDLCDKYNLTWGNQ